MNNFEHGIIILDTGTFITDIGEPIHQGDQIIMHFAGRPHNMPEPWIYWRGEMLMGADYKMHPCITVQAANKQTMTFSDAEIYTPEGVNHKHYFDKFLADPCGAIGRTLAELGVTNIP